MVRDAGIHVSGLCRGGMFPAATASERAARIDDNRRAIEEAAALNADVLVLVCGPAPDRDIAAARTMVAEAIETLIPYARECGVRLGIEPLHPMYAVDRSAVNTMRQANDICDALDSPSMLGIAADAIERLTCPIGLPGIDGKEPEVIAAASFFEPLNHAVLRDPRVRVVANDGRNHLLLGGPLAATQPERVADLGADAVALDGRTAVEQAWACLAKVGVARPAPVAGPVTDISFRAYAILGVKLGKLAGG
jgi:hypothetical protein